MITDEKLKEIEESAYHLYLQTDGNRVSEALVKIILKNLEDIKKELKRGK